MKLTRRALAGWAALSAVPLPKVDAQAPAQAGAPPAPANRQFQDAARQLASLKLARTVEPAFRFEA